MDDFELSLSAIVSDQTSGKNPVPDPLSFYYAINRKEEVFEAVSQALLNKSYSPHDVVDIDVPKGNFTVRPMARPVLTDWVIYEHIALKLIGKIAPKLSQRSYSSYQFKKPGSGIDGWKNFDDNCRNLFEGGYKYAVVTDITGYFENIDISILQKQLNNLANSDDTELKDKINFLCNNLLPSWSVTRSKRSGLPQGPSASSFLGDCYLNAFDREMSSELGYCRFMDDIRVFCKTQNEAKRALLKIITTLRKDHLSINAKKTKIITGEEIQQVLFDPRKSLLGVIQETFESKVLESIETVVPILIDDILFPALEGGGDFDKRHVRFSIFRLGILKASGVNFDEQKVVDTLLEKYINKPEHSELFCTFLSLFKENEKITNFLLNFLFSKENIYQWQELMTLQAILAIGGQIDDKWKQLLMRRSFDRNIHPLNRALCIIIVGKIGDDVDRQLLIDHYDSGDNDEVKRAIILGVQSFNMSGRNAFYGRIAKDIFPQYFVNYVKGLAEPLYYVPKPSVRIDNFENLKESYY